MSREDFVAVAARLFALYLLFYTLRGIPAGLQMLSQPDGGEWIAVYALLVAGMLAFVGFLWFFPLTIARKLLPVMREPRSETALDASTALSVGITLIGLWLLANAATDLSYWLGMLVIIARTAPEGFEWSPEQMAGMASTVVELVIALAFVLGSSGIRRVVARLKYGAEVG